ncbi:MAG TPA: nucleoside hydrolase [Candidatus Limnocylindrales bacterium]|jgi:pyrimidine-specific ribonucleoside hydrolase
MTSLRPHTIHRLVVGVALALLVAGCATTAPSPSPLPPAAPVAADPRPIVITTDMGMDDLLAIYVLLRDPTVDIRAITVDGTGLVHCGPGLRNMRRILTAFGRPEIPFACGRDDAGPDGTPFPDEWRATSDNLYGVVLPPVVGTAFPQPGAELLADAIVGAPAPVTILALGPWTTLQDLFAAHPDAMARVAGIHAMAGAIEVPGNMDTATVKPADGIEWNVGADPDSFAAVLALDVPVTLVPLDATDDVPVPPDIVARLETDHAAAGADIAYETYVRTPYLATEGNYWWDSAAAALFSDPGLGTWQDATISISQQGRISRDAGGRPARLAVAADGSRVTEAVLAGLRRGDPRPEPFAVAGSITVSWDGTTCRLEGTPPTTAGLTKLELHNRSTVPAGILAAGVREPRTWADALAWLETVDFATPGLSIPDWIVQVASDGVYAEAGADATSMVDLPPGTVGLVCGTGTWPDLTFSDGGSLTLAR